MADGNYARLVAACSHDKPLFPSSGRPRKACFDCWPGAGAKPKLERMQRNCRGCGAPGLGRKCQLCAGCRAKQDAKRAARVRQSKARTVHCEHCYREAKRRVSGGERDSGRYCSRQCAAARKAIVAAEIAGIRRLAVPDRPMQRARLVRSLLRELRRLEAVKRKAEAFRQLTEAPCVICGAPCGYVFGRGRKYCSRRCYRQSDGFRQSMRAARLKRKAAKRSVTVELVRPLKVFARDGWRCQLCGIKTPQAKRGTREPDAPELDHILPLTAGGEHSYRNTQCACRRCNHAKGATPKGQLLLIG